MPPMILFAKQPLGASVDNGTKREKVFISSDNRATFICPKCSRSRTEDVSKYLKTLGEIKVKIQCKCGNLFNAVIERRRFFRKKTDFSGVFTKESDGYTGTASILDLSKSGLRFRVSRREKLSVGDRLTIQFHLDDPARNLITKKIEIKTITGNNIGVQFLSEDQTDSSDKAIRFYLFGII
ncbi:MAG: PilZ domain-containing protein [Thermodesulfobacteriota bacterium]